MSVVCKKPPFTRSMFINGSKFRKQFLKAEAIRTTVVPKIIIIIIVFFFPTIFIQQFHEH